MPLLYKQPPFLWIPLWLVAGGPSSRAASEYLRMEKNSAAKNPKIPETEQEWARSKPLTSSSVVTVPQPSRQGQISIPSYNGLRKRRAHMHRQWQIMVHVEPPSVEGKVLLRSIFIPTWFSRPVSAHNKNPQLGIKEWTKEASPLRRDHEEASAGQAGHAGFIHLCSRWNRVCSQLLAPNAWGLVTRAW